MNSFNQDTNGASGNDNIGLNKEHSSEKAFGSIQEASRIIEATAYSLAGDVSRSQVSRLILIADELEKFVKQNGANNGNND